MEQKHISQTHKLVLTAIMAAINIVFVILNIYIPGLGLALVLFLPLASVVVALNVDFRFYPIYFVTTLALSFILSLGHIDTTLFLVLPALIVGLTIGSLMRIRFNDIYILLIVSFITFAIMLLTIPLINLIFDDDFVVKFLTLLNLDNHTLGLTIFPALMAVFSVAQTVLILFVIKFSKTYFHFNLNEEFARFSPLTLLAFAVLGIVTTIFYPPIAFVLLLYGLVLSIYIIANLFLKSFKITLVLTLVSLMVLLIFGAIFESFTSIPFYGSFNVMFFFIVISYYLWLYIDIKHGKEKRDG